ncbi:aldolase [Virgisporangium aliadipatigenens]|uniref:Aldolase n=1 Tax=Virgisporangium aliadipatigenens TaxID=741659 RepID=A0A8J3YJU9_9ACTN|nr:aldolase/citrate lyase family protein [Virgisporangium aliadipatigenens]GIJ46486.1 aldolase [Virgisporangium aliadipatigenens]
MDAGRLPESLLARLDAHLAATDADLAARYPGPVRGRLPIHTVYVPADRVKPGLVEEFGQAALTALGRFPPLPFEESLRARVVDKLQREPVEDLRVDFEDGYGIRPDDEEDAAVAVCVAGLRTGPLPPFVGLRCKSLEARTRARAVRTLDLFLGELGPLPAGFVITLPKVSAVAQVEAMVQVCAALETAHGLAPGALRFEIQIETAPAILDAGGTATVARMLHAAAGRCAGLHYGTYDYSAALGIAPAHQSMEHPAADHAKAVLQVAAAGTGVPVADGSTNIVPDGEPTAVQAAWALHLRLVRRSLERGFYQGWDLHPAQLPTRYAATYAFFRDGLPAACRRLSDYLERRVGGVLDEPATARAMAGFLLRALDCGAVDVSEIPFERAVLEDL